ncbi:polyribonucleotide nucleotidyltransferase [Candidatus Gracilibacteria bacterium]|nr:MAG: polyribonucleotide nucleotidyltransferase [Candidatus Gracilibacteria bacterium]
MIGISDKNAPDLVPLKKTYNIAGKDLSFETGKLGLLANGAITMTDTLGNMLFTTVGYKEDGLNEQADFFPLVVDYQEKFYATGKIGGNRFMKREARPSESATLSSRMIDRPIRPMFPKGIINDTQIICTVLSSDSISDLGAWGITSASLALLISGTPFEAPVSGVKIVLTNSGEYIFNPKNEEEKSAKLNLTLAGTLDAITMVEASGNEVSDEEMLKSLEYGFELIKELCNAQIDFVKDFEKLFGIPKLSVSFNNPDEGCYKYVQEYLTVEKLKSLYNKGKKEFQQALNDLDNEVREFLITSAIFSEDEDFSFVGALVYKRVKEVMRINVLEKDLRLDGRKLDEVRKVIGEGGVLPRAHGSAIFQRGMTQALTITTLGGPDDEQLIDGMMKEDTKRYIHHYNFPPYSVGEVRMMRGVGRREIGHGALAEKALEPVLPSEEDFPYVMRLVSEITTCNGSSSMASVCGSTMSLMNAGVPIKTPVAGVAMGMIYDDNTGNYKILSDIQAQEDFLGDMDFKVARTKKGITAMQLDVKIKGLKMKVFEETFAQSKLATDYILGRMLKYVPEVSKELSPFAPLIMNLQIPEDKIRVIIGKGGENVQRMEKDYAVKVSIADDGMTTITAETQEGGKKAIDDIKQMLWEPKPGDIYDGEVAKIIDGVGAIVDFKSKSGMVHISKLSSKRVAKVEDVVKQGDLIKVEVLQVDLLKGRISLKRIEDKKKN